MDTHASPDRSPYRPTGLPAAELDRFLARLEARLDERLAARLATAPPSARPIRPGRRARRFVLAGAGMVALLALGAGWSGHHDPGGAHRWGGPANGRVIVIHPGRPAPPPAPLPPAAP